MADLTEITSAQSVKIVGSDSAGVEQTPVGSHADGSLKVYTPGIATASNIRVGVTNSTTQLLAANSARKYAIIANNSGITIYLKMGAAAVVGEGLVLPSGAVFQITNDNLWVGSINAIRSGGGTATIDVFEGTP